jgi:hypothetical protein
MEIGLHSAYNLFKLPSERENYKAFKSQVDQLDMKAMALTVGIIAQVHIAVANLEEVKKRYELIRDIRTVYSDYINEVNQRSKTVGTFSHFILTKKKLEAALYSLDESQALGNYILAYYRLLNVLGVEKIDRQEIKKMWAEYEAREAKRKLEKGATKEKPQEIDNNRLTVVEPEDSVELTFSDL